MFIESNKSLVRSFFDEVLNARRLDPVDEMFAGHPLLADATKKTVAGYRLSVPDIRFTIDELIAEADSVVACWTARGTQVMQVKETPFNARRVTITGVYIFRIANGQFTGLRPMTQLPLLAPEILN
jgi:predicted ester cyclase